MEAQRYPDDFDGIIAGAPAATLPASARSSSRTSRRSIPIRASVATPPFTAETLKSVEGQIVAKCDAADGVTDGLLEDPRRCTVDVGALTGLTEQQKTILKTIYGETRNQDGVIFPAQPVGSEGDRQRGGPDGSPAPTRW